MEFILGTAVVIVLCIILQVSTDVIILIEAIICGLGMAVSAVTIFLYGLVIVMSKRKDAVLLRFEKKEGAKRKTAIYLIEGKEYKCAFPANPECMYKKDRLCKVLLNRRLSWVFDKYSLITYAIWLIFSVIFIFYIIKRFSEII